MKVLLTTTYGKIVLQLDTVRAPATTENFVQYVRDGHYDGTIFHRVISNFMIQGGGFTPDMEQKPTRPPIENEAGNGLSNETGTVAMARTSSVTPLSRSSTAAPTTRPCSTSISRAIARFTAVAPAR